MPPITFTISVATQTLSLREKKTVASKYLKEEPIPPPTKTSAKCYTKILETKTVLNPIHSLLFGISR